MMERRHMHKAIHFSTAYNSQKKGKQLNSNNNGLIKYILVQCSMKYYITIKTFS